MPNVAKQNEPGTTKVQFGCPALDARNACLVGSFNNWDPQASLMTRQENGEWFTALELAPGTYEYKFIVDGSWCCHPGVDDNQYPGEDAVPNCFGTKNRVMRVE